MNKEEQLKIITIKHKCGLTWRVSKNVLKVVYCPICKTSEGFKEMR